MGKSKSSAKASQAITNNTINKNYMDTLNKTIMNSAVETMINNASSCSSAVNQNNSCDMSNTKIGGNFDFSGNQTNKAKVDFSCIQASQTSADMNASMVASMMAEMKALNGTDAAAQLNTAAQSSNSTGFGASGGSSSSNSKTDVSNNVTNETITKLVLININGQIIKEINNPTFVNQVYELTNLPQGFFLLQLSGDKGNVTKKIIVN